MNLAKQSVIKLKKEGLKEFSRATISYLTPMSAIKLKTKIYRKIDKTKYTDADPFKIIYVRPDKIWKMEQFIPIDQRVEYDSRGRYHYWKNIGYVSDGDWDKRAKKYNTDFYKAAKKRYDGGKDWKETKFVKKNIELLKKKKTVWKGCKTEKEILKKCEYYDDLFHDLQKNGYRESQPNTFFGWKGEFDELTLNIGRDGKLMRNNSAGHRLALARIAGIQSMPARVLLRHKKWQERRNRINSASSIKKLDKETKKYLGHPDLRDIAKNIN